MEEHWKVINFLKEYWAERRLKEEWERWERKETKKEKEKQVQQ